MLMFVMAALGVLAAQAGAEQYWIAYEGNDFPENEGWWRIYSGGGAEYSGGGAERWIEDGMLVLDGLADLGINDLYGYNQYPIDPGPGELFVAEFRFAIDEIVSGPDPGIALFSDDSWAVALSFSDDSIRSELENETFDFDFVGFHSFRLTSSDMRDYTLEADGEVIREGVFDQVISASQLRWGDAIEGGASLTRWDHMRFGVVPEPWWACASVLAAREDGAERTSLKKEACHANADVCGGRPGGAGSASRGG